MIEIGKVNFQFVESRKSEFNGGIIMCGMTTDL